MGRPKLEPDIKLSRHFIFRLTNEELNKLIQAAETCGKSPAALVRQKLFKGKFPQACMPKLDLYAFAELKKIGVNLNQLTRLANSGRVSLDLEKILLRLEHQQEIIIESILYDSHPKNR